MPILSGIVASSAAGFNPLGAEYSIATATVTTNTSTVTFTDIPQTYNRLLLKYSARTTYNGLTDFIRVTFNGDTGANYTFHSLIGNMTSATANGGASQNYGYFAPIAGANATASAFGVGYASIIDYTSTRKNKTITTFGGFDSNGSGELRLEGSMWMNSTNAITSITLTSEYGGNFVPNSKFFLFGEI